MSTRGPLITSSPGKNARPAIGWTPSVAKSDGLTRAVPTYSGTVPFHSVVEPVVQTPTDENER